MKRTRLILSCLLCLSCSSTPQPLVLLDGSDMLADGSVMLTDGSVMLADGSVMLADGSVMLAGPVPAIDRSLTPPSVLGFTRQTADVGNWLKVDRSSGSVTLMEGAQTLEVTTAQGVQQMAAGSYQLIHKQRNALWYAPDAYFIARGLPVPPQGDASRYRRGALGSFALFVDENTPIHSGPVWVKEIGGALVDETELSKLYYVLPVGATVLVE